MATQNPGLYLFNDTFDIKELNPHKKRFERGEAPGYLSAIYCGQTPVQPHTDDNLVRVAVDRIVGESPLFQNEIVLGTSYHITLDYTMPQLHIW
jgi:hypothetical protein